MRPLVAIVDDEEFVRKALERLLRVSRLGTETFATCESFLGSLGQRRPDCVILDLHLPGMSGLELLQEMQARGIDVPTIVVTAHDEPEVRSRCLDAGARAYLRKPIDSSVLLAALARVLASKRGFLTTE